MKRDIILACIWAIDAAQRHADGEGNADECRAASWAAASAGAAYADAYGYAAAHAHAAAYSAAFDLPTDGYDLMRAYEKFNVTFPGGQY